MVDMEWMAVIVMFQLSLVMFLFAGIEAWKYKEKKIKKD